MGFVQFPSTTPSTTPFPHRVEGLAETLGAPVTVGLMLGLAEIDGGGRVSGGGGGTTIITISKFLIAGIIGDDFTFPIANNPIFTEGRTVVIIAPSMLAAASIGVSTCPIANISISAGC